MGSSDQATAVTRRRRGTSSEQAELASWRRENRRLREDVEILNQATRTKAQFLVRAKCTRRPPVLAVLPDGSWLTRIAGLQERVIDAVITVTGTTGRSREVGDRVRLLRPATHPAPRAGAADGDGRRSADTASGAQGTGSGDPPGRPAPTPAEVLDLLRRDPHRPWHGRDVAQILNVTNINSLCTRISQWAHKGLLQKIGRATYTLTPTT